MKKLLIAADSRIFAELLQESLTKQFDILTCHDGQEALQLLRDFRPDLLVIDLMLSQIDGIGVIKMAHSSGIRPQVVAYSAYITDYVTAALEQLNVACLIRLPCDHRYVAARILDVAGWQEQEPVIDRELRNILAVLGFRPNHAGCLITESCVRQYMNDPGQTLSTQLYPAVAKSFDSTQAQVERAMGRAVEAAWKARDEQVWRMYFPTGKNGKVNKPSNAQFLAVIGECLSVVAESDTSCLTG